MRARLDFQTGAGEVAVALLSLVSVRRSRRRIAGGVFAGNAFQSGSSFTIAASVSVRSSPPNAPARQHLVQHAAARPHIATAIDDLARACSGLCTRRCRMMPACVLTAGDVSVGDMDKLAMPESDVEGGFARPKSSTFTVPLDVSLTLAGFRSRCTMPLSCAASSASAICLAIRKASPSSGLGNQVGQAGPIDELQHERFGTHLPWVRRRDPSSP